jgi:rhodanese-related sulfurtransferase
LNDQVNFFEKKLKYQTDSWDLYESLERGERVIVIDARSQIAYAIEHIPTDVNISYRTMSRETTADLDPSYLYVTYCDGIDCSASTKGALNMARLGFQVKELMGGLDWWKRDGYATEGTEAAEGKALVCGC